MTLATEDFPYVGEHRYVAPAPYRGGHRRPSPTLVALSRAAHALSRSLRDTAHRATRGANPAWIIRMIARVSAVIALALAVLLGFGAIILRDSVPAAPAHPVITTPSPMPYPGGWTYGDE